MAVIGVVIVLVLRKDSTETKSASAPNTSSPPAIARGPAVNNPNLQSAQSKKPEVTTKEDAGPPDITSSMTTGDVYKRTLQSIAWVVIMLPNGLPASGSGTLVDLPNRVVLTNFHVIAFLAKTMVFFPVNGNEICGRVEPSSARAYVAVTGDNNVAVIDLKTFELEARIQTGNGPDGMAWVK